MLTIICACAPSVSLAATLKLSPASASYKVGDTFTVSVLVSSADTAMNAASGIVEFPPDILSVTSISKSQSVISLWVQEPGFSNAVGNTHFEGIVFNPGYIGTNGIVVRVTFQARREGVAHLRIIGGSVLANDGNGTEILSSASGADISVAASVRMPTPVATPAATSVRPLTPTVTPAPTMPDPPVPQAVRDITTAGFFEISGTTQPSALVEMMLLDRSGHSSFQSVQANESGMFRLVWSEHMAAGIYTFRLRAQTVAGIYSSSTPEAVFVVSPSLSDTVGRIVVGNILSILLVLVLVIMIPLFVAHRRLSRRVRVLSDRIHGEFENLKSMLAQEIRSLEKTRSRRALTAEEERFLNRFSKVLDTSERSIEREVKDLP